MANHSTQSSVGIPGYLGLNSCGATLNSGWDLAMTTPHDWTTFVHTCIVEGRRSRSHYLACRPMI
eukprot:6597169-Pyramimonas_sp.AAC.1